MLNKEKYYSLEADNEYFSVSQYKAFKRCEARELARLKGEIPQISSEAFLVGQYVHAWSEGTLDKFKEEHPEIISSRGQTKGQLKSSFLVADKMINALANDEMCMKVLEGEKEKLFTGELFGVKWKILVDVCNMEKGYFSDLKTTQGIYKKYANGTFIEQFGYIEQMAVYREIIKQNTGKVLQPYIVAVTKEEIPDKAIIFIESHYMDEKLEEIEMYMDRFKTVKAGLEEPIRCEMCDYCKSTKKVKKILRLEDLING